MQCNPEAHLHRYLFDQMYSLCEIRSAPKLAKLTERGVNCSPDCVGVSKEDARMLCAL